MPRYVPWCAAAALMLAGPSCEKQPAEAPAAPPVAAKPPAPAPQAPPGPARQHVAGIGFTVPKGWSLGAPRPMRFATFEVPKAAGDQEPADCGVYYFGPGEGGNVEANLARWLGQFKGPPAKFDRLDKRTIGGIQVTEVEQAGTFLWSPAPMAPQKTPKPGWRLLGAIVAAPEGAVFFKLVGPNATVAAAKASFEELLSSVARN